MLHIIIFILISGKLKPIVMNVEFKNEFSPKNMSNQLHWNKLSVMCKLVEWMNSWLFIVDCEVIRIDTALLYVNLYSELWSEEFWVKFSQILRWSTKFGLKNTVYAFCKSTSFLLDPFFNYLFCFLLGKSAFRDCVVVVTVCLWAYRTC